MRESDFDDFGLLLDATCSLLSRGQYTPNAANTALWFRSLAAHDLATVRAAFDAHVRDPQRGRFVPVPADILAQIEGQVADDGRPGGDEAWATALRAADEADTVVWTAEMAEAWAISKPVLAAGDEVGARMAFRDAYSRLVEAARRERQSVAWSASLGFDTERRSIALATAVQAGRLALQDLPALPAPRGEQPLLAAAAAAPASAREALRQLRNQIVADATGPRPPGPDGAAKAATADLRAQQAERVRAYADAAGIPLAPPLEQPAAPGEEAS
jgi:hypothetical protein